jgi:hypothetical protein
MLGELDEREPTTWERYNALAADHGIDVFIWDWYWYDNAPALHEALDDGFLRASNCRRLKFAVMWTNHPWPIWYPTVHSDGTHSRPHACDPPQSEHEVWQSLSYMIARYFHLPNYWQIDGRPVLVVWEAQRLRDQFGVEGTRALLYDLRAFARRLGHAGIQFHASQGSRPAFEDLAAMGFDSYGDYNPIVIAGNERPAQEALPEYEVVAADVVRKLWPEADRRSPLPYLPCISPGWDSSPRSMEPPRTTGEDRSTWPASTIVVNETPAAFEALARAGMAYLNAHPDVPQVLTIGCWNEWTEGHYLLPDTRLGYGMLKALARALGKLDEIAALP